MPIIAKVAVNDATIHFDKLYSYLVPDSLVQGVRPGGIVLVPFGRGDKPRMAVVLAVQRLLDIRFQTVGGDGVRHDGAAAVALERDGRR